MTHPYVDVIIVLSMSTFTTTNLSYFCQHNLISKVKGTKLRTFTRTFHIYLLGTARRYRIEFFSPVAVKGEALRTASMPASRSSS